MLGTEIYGKLSEAKVIKEAAPRSGVSRGVMQACWDAAGEVIKAKKPPLPPLLPLSLPKPIKASFLRSVNKSEISGVGAEKKVYLREEFML